MASTPVRHSASRKPGRSPIALTLTGAQILVHCR